MLYVNDGRNLARQVVALSFESAKAVAQLETSNGAASAPAATDRFQRMTKRATSSAGIFKQLPGTRFLWHEVSLTVLPGTDFRATQTKLLAAVESVFDEYRPAIEQQHKNAGDIDDRVAAAVAAD